MTDVFLSYSRKDAPFVRRLGDALTSAGRDVWVDWEDIPPTADWQARIHDGIDEAGAFVFVLSPDSAASAVCGRELDRAVEGGKRIIPLLWREVPDADVPPTVAALNWIDVRDETAFDAQVEVLLAAMDTDLAWVEEHTRRLTQAVAWDAKGRDRSLLLRGRELDAAEAALAANASRDPHPTELQIEYLQASRRAEARRQRLLLGSVSLALVVALVLAGLALVSRNEARRQRNEAREQTQLATSRELSASAANVLGDDPELSLMLASRALEIRPTTQAIDATRRALLGSHIRATIDLRSVDRVDLSADHEYLLTFPTNGVVETWRTSDGSRVARLPALAGLSDGGIGNVTRTQGAFSPRDSTILSITREGQAALFDPATGHITTRLGAATGASEVAWGDGGDIVAVGREDGTVEVFDLDDGARRVLQIRAGAERVYSIDISPDGGTIAASTADLGGTEGGLGVWDLPSGRLRTTVSLGSEGYAATIQLAAGGDRVVTRSRDAMRLWDTTSGTEITTLDGSATEIAVSRDGFTLVVGGLFAPISVIDAGDGEVVRTFDGHGTDVQITALEFMPSGLVASADDDANVYFWDPSTGDRVSGLSGLAAVARDLSASADGRALATAAMDGARVWNPGEILALPDIPATAGALDPDGRRAVIEDDDGIAVVDTRTGKRVRTVASAADGYRFGGLSDDGSTTWALGDDVVDVFAVPSGRRLARLRAAGYTANEARASADGKVVAATYFDEEERRRLVISRRGRAPVDLEVPAIDDLVVSPDGRWVATAAPGIATLVDARTGRVAHTATVEESKIATTRLAFSHDGRRLAASSDDDVRVFDTATGRAVGPKMRVPDQAVESLAFSPDDRRLAVSAFSGTDVFDLSTHRVVLDLGSPNRVEGVAWSADGEFLVTDDGVTTRVYLAAGERTQAPLIFLPGSFAGMSDDGRRLLTVNVGSAGSTALWWPCDVCQGPAGLAELARERITRTFSDNERRRYLHTS